jgi:hypothetical protein
MQDESYKHEVHSSIVKTLLKSKHFSSSSRLIDEVTYNIYKKEN